MSTIINSNKETLMAAVTVASLNLVKINHFQFSYSSLYSKTYIET